MLRYATAHHLPLPDAEPVWTEMWQSAAEPLPSTHPAWLTAHREIFTPATAAADAAKATDTILAVHLDSESAQIDLIAPLTLTADHAATFPFTDDLTDYSDFTYGKSADRYQSMLALIMYLQHEHDVTALRLSGIRDTSPTLPLLTEMSDNEGWHARVTEQGVAPRAELPATWQGYLQSLRRKDRHELRRKLTRLQQAGNVQFVRHTTPAAITAHADTFFTLHRASSADKAAFMTPERERFFRRILHLFAEREIAQLNFLLLDSAPIATSVSFISQRRIYLYNSGYSQRHAHLSAGLLCHAYNIQDAITRGCTQFDFMRGAEPYKYHLGATDNRVHALHIRLQ